MTYKTKTPLNKRSLAGLLVTALIGSLTLQIRGISEAEAWSSTNGAVSQLAAAKRGSDAKVNKKLHTYTEAVTVDAIGNVYAITRFPGVPSGDVDVDPDPDVTDWLSGRSAVIHKLDKDGNLVWRYRIGGQLSPTASIAIDRSGNVYAGFAAKHQVEIGPNSWDQTKKYSNYAVKLSPNGELQWSKKWGGGADDQVTDIALDSQGNVNIVGWVTHPGASLDPNDLDNNEKKTTTSGNNAFLLQLNPQGNTNLIKDWSSEGVSRARGVAIQKNGTIITVLDFGVHPIELGINAAGQTETTREPGSVENIGLLVAVNGQSEEIEWVKEFNSAIPVNPNAEIALDGDDNIFVGGTVLRNAPDGNLIDDILLEKADDSTKNRKDHAFLLKTDPIGNGQWAYRWGNATDHMTLVKVVTSPDGTVTAVGRFRGILQLHNGKTFGDQMPKKNPFIFHFTQNGEYLWEKRLESQGVFHPVDAAVDPFGGIYVSGFAHKNNADYDPSDEVVQVSQPTAHTGTHKGFVARYTADGELDSANWEDRSTVPEKWSLVRGPTTNSNLIWGFAEVVWDKPLCTGGRWEFDRPRGLAVRNYLVNQKELANSGKSVGEFIRSTFNDGLTTVPDYNVFWRNTDYEAWGESTYRPESFRRIGWGTNSNDTNGQLQNIGPGQPIAIFIRNGVLTFNNFDRSPTNSDESDPLTEIQGGSVPDGYQVYLAFSHPGSAFNVDGTPMYPGEAKYPEITEKECQPTANFTIDSTDFLSEEEISGNENARDAVLVGEDGTTASFNVVLTHQPFGSVTIELGVRDGTEVGLTKEGRSTTKLEFDSDNWNTPKPVTVTGADDSDLDGDVTSWITARVDHDISSYEYASVASQNIKVITEDDDKPANPDLDGDTILNEDEVSGCEILPDCDSDGINDNNEIYACVLRADCDGDGVGDLNETSQACIQDPACTGTQAGEPDPVPVVPDEVGATVVPAPTPPPAPPIQTPIPIEQPPAPPESIVELLGEIDEVELDFDGDGLPEDIDPDDFQIDTDGDGLADAEDAAPENADIDGDGEVDGTDPDPTNPDTDRDGILDGYDPDADGDGVEDLKQVFGLNRTPSSNDEETQLEASEAALPLNTLRNNKAEAELPPIAFIGIGVSAVLAGIAALAVFALLLGPTLVAAIARGRFGLWLIGLLFGRRGIHSEADNSTLIRRAGIWVDKETSRHTGTNGQVHVPRCFSKKHRELYLIMLAHISQSLRSLDANS